MIIAEFGAVPLIIFTYSNISFLNSSILSSNSLAPPLSEYPPPPLATTPATPTPPPATASSSASASFSASAFFASSASASFSAFASASASASAATFASFSAFSNASLDVFPSSLSEILLVPIKIFFTSISFILFNFVFTVLNFFANFSKYPFLTLSNQPLIIFDKPLIGIFRKEWSNDLLLKKFLIFLIAYSLHINLVSIPALNFVLNAT